MLHQVIKVRFLMLDDLSTNWAKVIGLDSKLRETIKMCFCHIDTCAIIMFWGSFSLVLVTILTLIGVSLVVQGRNLVPSGVGIVLSGHSSVELKMHCALFLLLTI